jgi:hypothetical protein
MWTHKTHPQFSAPWDRITRIHPTHHPKSRDGNLTYQIAILGDHPRGEEEDHHASQDHPQAVVGVAVVGVAVVGVEAEEVEEGEEEHFHCPDTRLPNQLKSF